MTVEEQDKLAISAANAEKSLEAATKAHKSSFPAVGKLVCVYEERLNELIQRLQADRHLTVFLISHDLSVVHQQATNVLCLSGGGRPAHYGAPTTILTPELLHEIYGTAPAFHVHEH